MDDDSPNSIPPLAKRMMDNDYPALYVASNHVHLAQTMDKESEEDPEDYVPSADDPPICMTTAESHYKDKEESKTILMTMYYRLISNDE
jgi:hypothetical protein